MATKITVALSAAVVILAACGAPISSTPITSSQEKPAANLPADRPETTSPKPEAIHISQFSQALSEILGLVQDMNVHPERNAVDAFALGFQWRPTPPEMNALLNAKKGYFGKIEGKTVLLGSDGTNDIFSIAVRDGFEPREIIASLGQILKLDAAGIDTSMGQTIEMYKVSDENAPIGLLSLTFGAAESLRGTGTLGFISASRAKAQGFSGW
jgi:hypothetical protein